MTLTMRMISASAAVLMLFGAPVVAKEASGARLFERLDRDDSGTVSLSEFIDGTSGRFDRLDADGNGTVSEAEIDAFIADRTKRIKDRVLSHLDADSDGSVTRAEYDETRRRRFARTDGNGDGEIDLDEAQEVFRNLGDWRRGMR